MRILDSVWRLTKLGLFVGWGAALTAWSACSGATVKPDTQTTDARPQDRPRGVDGQRDARRDGARDAGLADRPAPPPDRKGWDVPLE